MAGMTVIEVVVVLGIVSVVMTILVRFLVIANPISKVTFLQARSTETARIQLKRIAKQIRKARVSDAGAYPIVEMSPQRMVWYANVDSDAATERVSYELVGTELRRGVIQPSGNPIVYDTGVEAVTVVAGNVVNGATDIFTYYAGDYPVNQTPLTAADLTEVKYVQFYIMVDADPAVDPPPIEVRSQVQIRNLKTNLGE